MTVTSTALNAEKTVAKCISSVQDQTFTAWTHILIDAKSSDNTVGVARDQAEGWDRTLVRRNDVRKNIMENLWGIWQTLPDEEVIVWLDGDDWLAHDQALQVVADAYTTCDEPWLTYGQFMFANGEIGFASPYLMPPREDPVWRATHLKTFRAGLVKKIDPAHLHDATGAWGSMANDQAVMLPLLEMAGERHTVINNILYVYNFDHSWFANHDTQGRAQESNEASRIRTLPSYSRLETRPW
jgi:glycosyltransferase involved in cell wall biosynthesis